MTTRALRAAFALALAAAPAGAEWQSIAPGGDTACSDGSPYRFYVHPGDPGRLLVEFEGGGGCWSAETCALDIYTRRIAADPPFAGALGLPAGIYDRNNRENPFREWTHVYVPYCTGDLHWGNAAREYTTAAGPYTVQHKGAANAAAALRWTSESVPAPAQVAVVGCSAGGYGSILWSAALLSRYSGASVVQLSDSAAGVVPPGFFTTVLASWDVAAAWPKDIPPLALETLDPARLTLADVYTGIAGHHPLATFSQFNTLTDSTQLFFYALTGGGITATPAEWSARMQESIATLAEANPNFTSYTAPGSQHCIINSPGFYTTTVGGVRLVDWVTRLLSAAPPPRVP